MAAKKIWLTYAWKDNGDRNVDFIIQELKSRGLDVAYDRAELQAGRRLWEQIDEHISDPNLDAWIIYVTENSLQSEPCQEELAYALDRTLRTKDANFPLIGLFPEPIDRKLIPSAIATRLYVTLESNSWADEIADSVMAKDPSVAQDSVSLFAYEWHEFEDKVVLEVWPRAGHWAPFVVGVKLSESEKLQTVITGTRRYVTGTGMVRRINFTQDGIKFRGMQDPVSATNPAHAFFSDRPSEIIFVGVRNGKQEKFILETQA